VAIVIVVDAVVHQADALVVLGLPLRGRARAVVVNVPLGLRAGARDLGLRVTARLAVERRVVLLERRLDRRTLPARVVRTFRGRPVGVRPDGRGLANGLGVGRLPHRLLARALL